MTCLKEIVGKFGMEISVEKIKVLINSNKDITMDGETLEQVDNFKYLGALITEDGESTIEIRVRLCLKCQDYQKCGRIKKINCNKDKTLQGTIVTSIALYGCESWTLLAETEKSMEAFEIKCYRKILNISYRDRKTNDYVHQKIEELREKQEHLLQVVKCR